MKTLISRFVTKNEPFEAIDALSEDNRHSLLEFLIDQGSNTPQLQLLYKRVTEFVFPENEFVAEFSLVQLYLELEWFLIYKDPRYIGKEEKLRDLVKTKFPKLINSNAFLPLYTIKKNQEVALFHNFLMLVAHTFNRENRSEKIASRWLAMLKFISATNTEGNIVKQINTLRKFRECAQGVYHELIDTFGKEWVNAIFAKCHSEFTSYYIHIKTVKCLDDLLPKNLEGNPNVSLENLIKPNGISGHNDYLNEKKLNADVKSNGRSDLSDQKVLNGHKVLNDPSEYNGEIGFNGSDHTNGRNGVIKMNPIQEVGKKEILENILDGFVLFDRFARIIDFNENALKILGVNEETLRTQTILDFLPNKLSQDLKKDLEKSNPSIANIVIGKRQETILKQWGGTTDDYEITITNNYTEGDDTFSIFLKNITNKIDTLKSIREAKINAERTAKAKSTFLSNMSHEIRTPLNVILGLSELINKNDHIDEKLLRKNIDGIDFSAKNLLSIVNDILDFSKIEAGKLTIQSIDFNLRKLVTTLADGFEIKALEKGLKLVANIDPDIPSIVIGDQFRLNQILTNLISNAIKFTQTGEIKINVALVSQKDEEIGLQFNVVDTGIGIAEDKLDKIFDSFYQLDNPESPKVTGTGLGLAITKELIHLQDGVLNASSVVGEGSNFVFLLTFKRSKLKGLANLIPTFTKSNKKLNGLKVLVAEDNKMNQFYIKQLLKKLDVETDIAENGQEAVKMFQNSDYYYDLVLMDMHMPIMDGIEAISLIRKSKKYSMKKTSIVACSADVFPEARKNAIKAGIDFYLTKPLSEEALKEVLNWLISDDQIDPQATTDKEMIKTPSSEVKSSNVDINHLKETFDNDEEFIISLLEVFTKITPDDYKSMRNCIEREYYMRASSLAHKMKSSFMNLGMTIHGHHLQQIESSLLKKEGVKEAKKHLTAFSSLYTRTLLEVNILLIELRQK
jgi:PAS domain S-box-containing protein